MGPAAAQFALTSPSLWPRVSKIEGMRPFTFLTIAYLDPAAMPAGSDTFHLLPFVSPKEDRWSALADREGAKTWEHILDAFARHRDRKYTLGPDGRIVRRSVTVGRHQLVGLGKEGGRYAARLKLGRASGVGPSVFVDWKGRLLEMGRAEARRLGLPYRTVKQWKAALRERGDLRGDARERAREAILAGGGGGAQVGQRLLPIRLNLRTSNAPRSFRALEPGSESAATIGPLSAS